MLYQSNTLKLSWLEDNIAELLFDSAETVNKLDTNTVHHLGKALDVLSEQSQLAGLVLRSSKPAFIVGADINEFLSLFAAPPQQLRRWLENANRIFNKLEDLNVPTVCAITSYALGGGCECVLATDYRIATADIKIGLPETKLGIMPGFGGSVRLPRLIGLDNALELITAGRIVSANEALKLGFIDAVVAPEALQQGALKIIKQAMNGSLDWKAKRQIKKEPLKLNATEKIMSFSVNKSAVMQIAGKHYPAPVTAINAIEAASKMTRDDALSIETENFVQLTQTPQAKALVGIFLNEQYVKNQAKKFASNVKLPEKIAVLGAGIMGGGITYQAASSGFPVVMKDINQVSLDTGIKETVSLLNKQLERKKLTSLKMAQTLSSITPTMNVQLLEGIPFVIEAVTENPKIKTTVLSEVEKQLPENAVITSNTSTIPINTLANALQRPQNFCGMHFFNPVHRMPLVEIIRGKETSDSTIAQVVAFASAIGKTPIVVNDCPGFFVNRVLFPYFAGFSLLMRDGADFRQIDKVMEKQFGWPMGPAYLLDVVGIDTAHHAQAIMAQGFPQRMSKDYRDVIDVMFENQRFGQKNGTGFYRYVADKSGKLRKEADESVSALLSSVCQPAKSFTDEEIIMRLMIPMVNEVIRCLEEKIISSSAEADMALVYGLGFPPFRGGALRYLDTIGSEQFLKYIQQYRHLGALYQPPADLERKAEENCGYYAEVLPATNIAVA